MLLRWPLLIALVSAVARISALPTALRVSSTATDVVVRHAIGEYEADGEVNGATRYKRLAKSQPQAGDRFFFLSATARWSIANSSQILSRAVGWSTTDHRCALRRRDRVLRRAKYREADSRCDARAEIE